MNQNKKLEKADQINRLNQFEILDAPDAVKYTQSDANDPKKWRKTTSHASKIHLVL